MPHGIDLFRFHVCFFLQYKSFDNTPNICFFQISNFNLVKCIISTPVLIYEKTKGQVTLGPQMKKHGKAQEAYSSGLSTAPSVRRSNLIVLQISLQLLRHIQISFHPKASL